MPRLILILLMFMVTAVASGCGKLNEKPVAQGEIRLDPGALTSLRAEADAHAALAKGDRHLTANYGITTLAPGAPNDEVPADWPHGLLVIEGTSDDGDYTFNKRATAYARAYNRVILEDATAPRT
ncbi:hypothetical protein D3C72_1367830 [compost metagenome]